MISFNISTYLVTPEKIYVTRVETAGINPAVESI